MRFRIAKLSINRSWVNCDQVSFWFQIPRKNTFQNQFPARSANGRSWLSLPRKSAVLARMVAWDGGNLFKMPHGVGELNPV